MNKKYSIGVDADDSLIQTTPVFNNFHNFKYGKNLRYEDYHIYDFSKIWEITNEQILADEVNFYESEFYNYIIPCPGAVEAVDYLSNEYGLDVITGRSKRNEIHLHYTLQKHFQRHHFSSITHLSMYDTEKRIEKWEKCIELNNRLLIDDHCGHLIKAAEKNIHGILMEAPWNKNMTDLPKLITKVRNWEEVTETIEKNRNIIFT